MNFLEKDLYIPVKDFLEQQGYTVQAEVKNCDLAAEKDGEIVVVELKKSFTLKLLYQAVDRQSFADGVYVAIGRDKKGMRQANYRNMVKILKKLNIGLLIVSLDSDFSLVQEVLSPIKANRPNNSRKRKAVKKELNSRTQNVNIGGVTGKKIITAYRERALELLCLLEKEELMTYARLKELGYDKNYQGVLYKNFYGWFERAGKAKYGLSAAGIEELEQEEFRDMIQFYRKKVSQNKP